MGFLDLWPRRWRSEIGISRSRFLEKTAQSPLSSPAVRLDGLTGGSLPPSRANWRLLEISRGKCLQSVSWLVSEVVSQLIRQLVS